MENIICCPFCGAEYMPGEIFLPKHFLGQPKCINKNDDNKIIDFKGIKQDLEETYTCDNCNSIFKVKANIQYEIEKVVNLQNSYIQKL